ncbi:RNA-binding S4 domain-containing protein [Salinisphaera orenii]|uniref:RNA-binding S4 domain-containing protein n=1 Tax=Salinisphaera orenii TaxID=856731 RepID=UPI000DBE1D7D
MAKPKRNEQSSSSQKARIDRWLWAARFFKTRGLAHSAIKGGKVELNGTKAKPASGVGPGDRLHITKDQQMFEVDVQAISEQRGPATEAEKLYTETQASHDRREREAAARRATRHTTPTPQGRPDRKQRRALRQFKQNH